MRSLALAGIAAVLAGCSLPYVDTSFKAMPKPEHMAEGEHREVNDGGPSAIAPGADTTPSMSDAPVETRTRTLTNATSAYTPDRDDSSSSASVDEGGPEKPTSRTSTVFPPTAPPAGG